jgi:hypothetical protein
VLTVAALQIRDPVPFIVLVETDDAARHGAVVIHHGGAWIVRPGSRELEVGNGFR